MHQVADWGGSGGGETPITISVLGSSIPPLASDLWIALEDRKEAHKQERKTPLSPPVDPCSYDSEHSVQFTPFSCMAKALS